MTMAHASRKNDNDFPRRREQGRLGEEGGGRVTHEPPLRMAERSPAAKQSIYAFKMAARNATHPTISLYIPPHVTTTSSPHHVTHTLARSFYIPLTYAPEAL